MRIFRSYNANFQRKENKMKKNKVKIVLAVAVLFAAQYAFCGPHHHHDDGRGVRLATDIVNLVKAVVTPAPAVVVTPAPAPAAVVVTPPAVINYGYYNNVYVPCYNGWYYYGNVWCWGGRGPRPPAPPAWRPPHRHHRPVPPPPPVRRPVPVHHGVRPVPPPPPVRRPAYGRPAPGRPMPGRPVPGAPAPGRPGGRR